MKKYFFIYKSEVMSHLQYIFNIFVGFISYFILIFIFFNLWQYMYSDSKELINGYSMNQMIWYVIITEMLWMCTGGRMLCRKISEDVKGGNIAYNINKPYSYIGYSLFSHLGSITIKFILYLIVGLLIGFIFLRQMPLLDITSFILIIISMVLAIIISTLLVTFIGLFSFIVEDSVPFYWLYSKFILIIGTIFPIEFFPKAVQPFLNYSPIYAVSYGPAKLFVNFSYIECVHVLIVQIIYIVIAYLLCSLIYKKGVRKLNVNGG